MDLRDHLVRNYKWDILVTRHMLDQVLGDLTEDELNWQPRPGHHSIWHNLWHMFLSNDYYFAHAMETPPVWEEGRWRERIDLSTMARAFECEGNALDGAVPRFVIADVPDSLVDELKAAPVGQYLAYVDDMLAKTTDHLAAASEQQLLRRVPWYGRDIIAYRQATAFGHVSRHIGMIEDLKGLIRGPGAGTASI